MYVIMKKYQSPIAITSANVHGYVETLKEAKDAVERLNKKAMSNHYWYVKTKKLSE